MRRVKVRTYSGVVCEQEVFDIPDKLQDVRTARPPRPRFATPEEREQHKLEISRRKHTRLFNANFGPTSLYSTLTFSNEYEVHTFEEAKRLRSLSAKLLELLTVGSVNLTFEPTPLDQVVGEVAVSLEPLLAQTQLTLSCSCPPLSIAMDRELFKSLLYNLLDNARKASPTGGRLSFTAQAEGEKAVLKIRDWGQGIPPKELEKICQPFYMVDKSRSRKAGGAGLGLALCQAIVVAHQGTMEFWSQEGEGTQVTLTFPLCQEVDGHENA